MKILLAVFILVSVIGHSALGRTSGSGAPPPPACGADTAVANSHLGDITEYLTLIDRSSFGFPFPPPQGSVVRVTAKQTCSAAITAYNAAFPIGHASRIADGIYLFKIGTVGYAVTNENLLHFYNNAWTLLFAVTE